MSSPSTNQPHKIRVLVHNTARSHPVLTSTLELAATSADIVLVQEPWIGTTGRTVPHPSFQAILPTGAQRLRTAAFINIASPWIRASPRPDISQDSDMLVLDISTPSIPTTRLVNIYNEVSQQRETLDRTVERSLVKQTPHCRSVFTGDFNAHHPWWNSNRRAERSDKLVDWAT